jgi:glucose/arabinose dehydrogenase
LKKLAYSAVVDSIEFPILVTARPGSDTSYLATKDGRVWTLTGQDLSAEPVLDISDRVQNSGERGFLGLALPSDDTSHVFAHYSDTRGNTTVSRFTVRSDGTIDSTSEQIVFTADQPAGNHNGGWLQFGPDGMLYLGLGDGGGANDQFGNGQADTMLAGLVQIDTSTGKAVKYAKGLRNPWRFWIDDRMLYIGDVGQGSYEEVDVAPLEPALNFGWSIVEGQHCFSPRSGCDTTGLTMPVVEIAHGDANTCSITGGVVYRGARIPEIQGRYFYSDYCGGYLRSFIYADGRATDPVDYTDQVGVPGQVVSFGTDGKGEMYVLTTTQVLRVVPIR